MKNNIIRLAAAVGVAGLIASMAPISAFAATTPTYDTTTDAPIYLVDQTSGLDIAAGTQLDWDVANGIMLSGKPMAEVTDESQMRLPAPTNGALTSMAFIAPVGSERTKSAWKSYALSSSELNGVGPLQPTAWPGTLGAGTPAAVKSAGGLYSMGVAYLKNNDLDVVSAFYTTINVDAGTGTWTFAGPAPVCNTVNTDITTTTSVVAAPATLDAGSTTTLTATVSASKAVSGNVQFFEGTTLLGTGAISGGEASNIVTVGTAGTHTYSAKYVSNVVETASCPSRTTDTYLASTSADIAVIAAVPAVAMPPMAPSDNALNANTAHGATASYNAVTHSATLTVDAANNGTTFHTFVYSTPTYLGEFAVAGGTITADVSMLDAGDHKMAITNTVGDVVAWATFTKTDAAIDPSFTKQINADVANAQTPADGEFSLTNLSGSTVNLTNPALVNGQSVVSGELGNFKVTDLRQVSKPGWDLTTTVADFTKGGDTIGKSALGIAPKVVSQAGSGATAPTMGAAQVSGAAVYPWDFAELAASAFSGVSTYNADLVFTAPAGKPAGTYSSTLTLTLISK